MSNFARQFPSGTPFDGELPSAVIEYYDIAIPKAPNFTDGSTHTASVVVSLAGKGMTFPNVVLLDPSATKATWADNCLVDVNTGGWWTFKSGSLCAFAAGASVTIACDAALQSGSNLIVASGADIEVNNGGDVNVNNGGTVTIASGGTVSAAAGSNVTLSTNVTVTGKIIQTTAPTTRLLLWEIQLEGSVKLRLYSRHSNAAPRIAGGFEFTTNASWTGTQWTRDVAGAALILECFELPGSSNGLATYDGEFSSLFVKQKQSTGSNWNEDAWDATLLGLGAGNPVANFAYLGKNLLTSKNVKKAWGKLTTDGAAGVVIDNGFGLASVAIAGGQITVTLRNAMVDTHYCPTLGMAGATAIPGVASIVSTSQFKIGFRDFAGTAIDAGTNIVTVFFQVDGEQ